MLLGEMCRDRPSDVVADIGKSGHASKSSCKVRYGLKSRLVSVGTVDRKVENSVPGAMWHTDCPK